MIKNLVEMLSPDIVVQITQSQRESIALGEYMQFAPSFVFWGLLGPEFSPPQNP